MSSRTIILFTVFTGSELFPGCAPTHMMSEGVVEDEPALGVRTSPPTRSMVIVLRLPLKRPLETSLRPAFLSCSLHPDLTPSKNVSHESAPWKNHLSFGKFHSLVPT